LTRRDGARRTRSPSAQTGARQLWKAALNFSYNYFVFFFFFGPLVCAMPFLVAFLVAFLAALFVFADLGALFSGSALGDFAFFGSAGDVAGSASVSAGSAGWGGMTFAGLLSRIASAFWRASANAKRASRKARI
jgi:hypothetical protein